MGAYEDFSAGISGMGRGLAFAAGGGVAVGAVRAATAACDLREFVVVVPGRAGRTAVVGDTGGAGGAAGALCPPTIVTAGGRCAWSCFMRGRRGGWLRGYIKVLLLRWGARAG